MTCLFQNKNFISAAGLPLSWKVECDALYAPGNWEWAAARVAERCKFSSAYGIPNGGIPFADACYMHVSGPFGSYMYNTLIVDDVWTTGKSIRQFLQSTDRWDYNRKAPIEKVVVWVLFSRNPIVPPWLNVLWSYTGDIKKEETVNVDPLIDGID